MLEQAETLPGAPDIEYMLPSGKQTNRVQGDDLAVSDEPPRAFAQKHPRAKGFQRKVKFFKKSPAASALKTRHLKPVVWAQVTNDDKSIVPVQCENADGTPRIEQLAADGLLDHYNAWKAGKTEVKPQGTPLAVLGLGTSVEDWLAQRGIKTVEQISEANPRELVEIMGPDEGPQMMQLAREYLAEKQSSAMGLGNTPAGLMKELQEARKENAEIKQLLRQLTGKSDPPGTAPAPTLEELAAQPPEGNPQKRKGDDQSVAAA